MPSRPAQNIHTQTAILPWWLLYVCFVIYGSLVPLEYQPIPWDQAWLQFKNIQLLNIGAQGRADWVANGVLYIPVGFLTVSMLLRAGQWKVLALIGALLFGFALALAVEFTQIAFPARTVSLNDVFAEFVGSMLGTLLAIRWSERFRSLLAALLGNTERLFVQLLKAYVIAYLAFSLFPYDFLLSAVELEAKLSGRAWGWFLAPDFAAGNVALTIAKIIAETLAVVPLGWLLCQMQTRSKTCALPQALLLGALLGLAIELAQLLIVSGISQGLSVLTRGLGAVLGVWLWQRRERFKFLRLASGIRRFGLPLSLLYLIVLTALNGWFDHRWLNLDHAMLAYREVHLLPFYYHYYTTEQAALLSLVSVGLMYAPIGILIWASWSPPGAALALAVLLAAGMETSKLFLENLHPDPTNLLIAGVAAWLAAKLAQRLTATPLSQLAQTKPGPAQAATPPPTSKHPSLAQAVVTDLRQSPSLLAYVGMAVGLAGAAWGVATFPSQPLLLALLLTAYAALIWFRPHCMLIVIPAALALLDLAPWSGRFYFDEFDLLLLISVTIGYARLPPVPRRAQHDLLLLSLTAVLGLAYIVSAMRGLLPWQMPDLNAFNNYYSSFSALRTAKAVLWAFLLYGLLRRWMAQGRDVRSLFAGGMLLGLAGTITFILWERNAFPGIFNFSDDYRVTGPFSYMHIGGAGIETYLTLAVPFVVLLLFNQRAWLLKLAGLLLLLGTTYSVLVTFARMGTVAYSLALIMALLAATASAKSQHGLLFKRSMAAFVLLALVLAVALPIFTGSFAQTRLSQSQADIGVRLAHWSKALEMRDGGLGTELFGMGLGRYPETHYWRSPDPRAAAYRLGEEAGKPYLRLGTGSPLYMEQLVTVQAQQNYVLNLLVRGVESDAQLSISLCEKWLLTSARCVFKTVEVKGGGQWQSVQITLASGAVGSGPWYAARPVKLSLFNAQAQAVVDVGQVSLQAANQMELLRNGNFSQGLDAWFFSVDNDRPWRIWSLPVHVLFEQGWLGVLAWSAFVALGLWRAARATWRNDAMAGAMLAATLGFLIIGGVASLIDSPRLLLLFLLLVWFCARSGTAAIQR